MDYLFLVIVTLVLGLGTQAYINAQYKKWSKIPISTHETGAQAARRMLDANGLCHVAIEQISGKLSDHYDPKANVLRLSSANYNGGSVAATAVACHEAGHAVQHACGYGPARVRMALVPAANFASNSWIFILIAGIFLNIFQLVYVAIALYAIAVLFQFVTLPVEFDASHRALATVGANGMLPANEAAGARKVLTAAALTYVAAALSSLLQLLYYLGMARR